MGWWRDPWRKVLGRGFLAHTKRMGKSGLVGACRGRWVDSTNTRTVRSMSIGGHHVTCEGKGGREGREENRKVGEVGLTSRYVYKHLSIVLVIQYNVTNSIIVSSDGGTSLQKRNFSAILQMQTDRSVRFSDIRCKRSRGHYEGANDATTYHAINAIGLLASTKLMVLGFVACSNA